MLHDMKNTDCDVDVDGKKSMVMIVDDNVANLRVARNSLSDSYVVYTAPSAAKMFDLLKYNKPDVILLDIDMPEMDGYEAIKILKADRDTRNIQVIFLTAKNSPENELEGLSLGAVDYISKPFMPELLRKRVDLHITVDTQKRLLEYQTKILEEQGIELKRFNENLQKMIDEKTDNVLKLQRAILKTVADLVENRDCVTGSHIARTQHGLMVLLNGLKNQGVYRDQIYEWDMDLLLDSCQLHDVGKIAISDYILNKPARLTADEYEEMKKHTVVGVKIIEKIEGEIPDSDFLKYAKIFAGTHQEKWDGTGYPSGLTGEAIPLPGRLLAIADVYDALVSERPYKKPCSHEEAVRIILEGKGTHFDPVLVDVFERVADQFVVIRQAFSL
jgi:putative two-component system response regulator